MVLSEVEVLQTTNAELARSLATAQWNLEVEVCFLLGHLPSFCPLF